MDHPKDICVHIVDIIRHESRLAKLVRADEILTELEEQGLLQPEDFERETYFKITLKRALDENEDIKEILSGKGISYYYSVQSLSETYAGILALKAEGPLRLIAETVRENSRLYPRPVPLVGFMEPPFSMTREAISACLQEMGDDIDYRDIAQTTTSVGTPYLYSSRHIDPDHASMLAEWLDVGQADNP
jgi:hypothetical protein